MDAMSIMLKNNISCLPVIQKGQLIGLITDTDLNAIQAKLKSSVNINPTGSFTQDTP